MVTSQADWYGESSQVSQTRGRVFEALCLAATSVGLVSVLVLLLYVANDAFKPLSAELGWHLTYLVTLVVPAGALAVYYYRSEGHSGEVAYTTTGLPIVGLLLGGGLLVVFAELVQPKVWFAFAIGIAAVGAILFAHARVRPTATLERLLVGPVLAVVVLFGTPPTVVARFLGLSQRIVSLPELVLKAPYLPLPSLQLLAN